MIYFITALIIIKYRDDLFFFIPRREEEYELENFGGCDYQEPIPPKKKPHLWRVK